MKVWCRTRAGGVLAEALITQQPTKAQQRRRANVDNGDDLTEGQRGSKGHGEGGQHSLGGLLGPSNRPWEAVALLGPGPAAMALIEDIAPGDVVVDAVELVGAPAALAPAPFMWLLVAPWGMLRLVALRCCGPCRCSARFAPPGIRLSL